MPLHKFNNPGLVYYKALSKYLELVKDIPEVVEVRLSANDELHTIIAAPRDDDDIRYQVIDAELAVMRSVESQPFLFHLVNSNRLPQDGLDKQIGSFGDLIWKREGTQCHRYSNT